MAEKEKPEDIKPSPFETTEDYSLFEPSKRDNSDIRMDFPEIAENPGFKSLDSRELRFIWMYANRTSPLFALDKKKRAAAAAKVVYGMGWHCHQKGKVLGNMNFEEKHAKAIEEMVKFNPSIRLRGRLMTEYTFDQLQMLIIVDPSEFKTMDGEDKKKYADLLLKVNQELPSVINNLERGFGIIIKKTKGKELALQPMVTDLIEDLGND